MSVMMMMMMMVMIDAGHIPTNNARNRSTMFLPRRWRVAAAPVGPEPAMHWPFLARLSGVNC